MKTEKDIKTKKPIDNDSDNPDGGENMSNMRTVWVSNDVIDQIDNLKIHKRETKGDIIERLVQKELSILRRKSK